MTEDLADCCTGPLPDIPGQSLSNSHEPASCRPTSDSSSESESTKSRTLTQQARNEIDEAYNAWKAGTGTDSQLLSSVTKLARIVGRSSLRGLHPDQNIFDEIADDGLLALLRQFKGNSRPSSYVYAVIQNACNKHRSKLIDSRIRCVSISFVDNEPPIDEDKEDKREEDRRRQVQNRADIEKLASGLPEKQHQVVELWLEGFSLTEIAAKLGVPIGTVRSRYLLAMKKMRLASKAPLGEEDSRTTEELAESSHTKSFDSDLINKEREPARPEAISAKAGPRRRRFRPARQSPKETHGKTNATRFNI